MNTISYRYGQDGDESRPLPDLHADVQQVLARRDLDVQHIRWGLAQMGLAISNSPDTVRAETTVDVNGQVVTVTDTQHLRPGQDPATIRAAVWARAGGEATQEALDQAQIEQAREEHAPQHRAPHL